MHASHVVSLYLAAGREMYLDEVKGEIALLEERK